MAKLIHKNKTILKEMKYITNSLALARGLMFASEEKVKKGACLVIPGKDKIRNITMLFCFYPYEILFVNSKFKVVDKALLKPWKISYSPKKPYKYAIESWKGTFKTIRIGDKVQLDNA